jgi:hypothetical protein
MDLGWVEPFGAYLLGTEELKTARSSTAKAHANGQDKVPGDPSSVIQAL